MPSGAQPQRPDQWWRRACVYQIYPRSFADGNGDGIGDLPGIINRLAYLERLGIDAIWLSPFYPSPWADGGYDITDHRDVDPRLGTLEDFEELTTRAHACGIKVVVDIVPNHTSNQHPWFIEALASAPGSPERERYVFRPGIGDDGSLPPSDWKSHFGGSAWERTEDGEWYCHLFAREQPDLNWDHPQVRQYFEDTLRFWADRGVDGFRIDVAHALAKDLSDPLRSQPNLDQALPTDGSDPLYDRDEVHAIYRSWRKVFDEYEPPRMAVAETWHPISSRTYLYARSDELGQVFDFSLLKSEWGAQRFRAVIRRAIEEHRGVEGGLTWVLSSHDVPRHASRLALPVGTNPDLWLLNHGQNPRVDPVTASRRARAASLLMLALPGSPYLYQGEELGLLEVADLPVDILTDPVWERTSKTLKGRDGARVPLPWTTTGTSFGFGANGAWLPQPSWFADYSVEAEEPKWESSLNLYRRALRTRRELMALADDDVTWLPAENAEILHFTRSNGWECLTNFSNRPALLPTGREIVLTSCPEDEARFVPGETTVWLQRLP